MSAAEREMAAASWRRSMAPLLERRVGPRKVALEPDVAPATRWNPVLGGRARGPDARHVRAQRRRAGSAARERRRHRVRAGDQAVALDRAEGAHLRAPDEHLSSPDRAVRSASSARVITLTKDLRARAGEAGRRGDRGGQVSRAAARHSVRREGSARHRGHRDDLRRGAVQEPRAGRRRRGRAASERGRRRARRQAEPGRARAQRHLVRRPDDEPVAARGRRVGIERGARRGDRRGARRLLDRQRNRRQHRRARRCAAA